MALLDRSCRAVQRALAVVYAERLRLAARGLRDAVMIDCSHGNSHKDYHRQAEVAASIAEQVSSGSRQIFGAMLESLIVEGRQDLVRGRSPLYGQSITDGYISLAETDRLLDWLAKAQQNRESLV